MHYFVKKYNHRILIRYICCHCAESDCRHVCFFLDFFVHDFCSQQIFKALRYTAVNFETINALSFRIIVNVITFAFLCLLLFRIFFQSYSSQCIDRFSHLKLSQQLDFYRDSLSIVELFLIENFLIVDSNSDSLAADNEF